MGIFNFFSKRKEKKKQEYQEREEREENDWNVKYDRKYDRYYDRYYDINSGKKTYSKTEDTKKNDDFDDFYERFKSNKSEYFNENFGDIFEEFFKEFGQQSNWKNSGRQQFNNPPINSNLDNSFKLMKLNKEDDETTIKKRYRELSMKWHPDRWTNNTKENQEIANRNFIKLNNAYECIKKHKNIK